MKSITALITISILLTGCASLPQKDDAVIAYVVQENIGDVSMKLLKDGQLFEYGYIRMTAGSIIYIDEGKGARHGIRESEDRRGDVESVPDAERRVVPASNPVEQYPNTQRQYALRRIVR